MQYSRSILVIYLYIELCVLLLLLLLNHFSMSILIFQFIPPPLPLRLASVTHSCPTLCDPMDCSTPGFSVHHKLPEPAQTHVHWVSDAIQPSHPLLSPLLLPSIFPSIRVFSNELILLIRWPKYWSFSFSINPSNEYSGLISINLKMLIESFIFLLVVVVQSLSHVWLFVDTNSWTTASQTSLFFSLVQFSRSVVSDSLQPRGKGKHTRLPCPSPTPRAYSNSCPSGWWCHPTISSSVVPSPPAFNLSQHQGFSNELVLLRIR